ncbi:hypothetical protein JM93_01574 [Roseibium hamelinense]|uniref:Uncharacterized protein n=1 Tax=Roseibium hamelinense TaxID=150831 RepID=A0A562T748_9HYPH|nr:hypothetical protein [Roseibium hamelinense]MTI43691.1 hypothetical protein [Roseibium hamelinense]TWI89371.1 hypothetical protein JM93_01574 [Roseibium hamelinense]
MTEDIARSVIERGDLAHLALFLWAVCASVLTLALVRELSHSNRRFSDFVEEIARLNRRLNVFRSHLSSDGQVSDPTLQNRRS